MSLMLVIEFFSQARVMEMAVWTDTHGFNNLLKNLQTFDTIINGMGVLV